MPIGSGTVYNIGDLILSQVSGSGTSFLETKIAAATSSLIYFDNTARINSASLNSITVGTASYVSGSTSIITNLTASNISASATGSFGIVDIGTTSPAQKLDVTGNTLIGPSGGKMFIGDVGHGTTYPALSHQDYATTTGYALLAPSNGHLFLNKRDVAGTYIGFRKANNDLMVINNDGNVGIGKTNPVNRLDVVGNINCSVLSSSNAYFSNIGFTNQTVASDTATFPTGSTAGGFILDGGVYTNGLYRTRFVKIDREIGRASCRERV